MSWMRCFTICIVLATAIGCESCPISNPFAKPEVTYVPGFRQTQTLKKGDEAPFDGILFPPAVVEDIGPCINELRRKYEEDEG